jgi:PAS domain S-box-containing protein
MNEGLRMLNLDESAKTAGATRDIGSSDSGQNYSAHEILEALPEAVYVTDAEGRITFYNEAAAQLWGVRPELGRSKFCGSWKLYWPDGTPLPHSECPMATALKEKRPIRGLEAIAERPDGVRVRFLPFPTPLFDAQGELTGAVNILVDLTERNFGQDAAQRLAAIVEFSDDAILAKDPGTGERNVSLATHRTRRSVSLCKFSFPRTDRMRSP